MIDPVTALGLVSSIAQIVDFGTKIVTESREVYRNGSTIKIKESFDITNGLRVCCEDINNGLLLPDEKHLELTTEDQESHAGILSAAASH